VDRQKRRSRFVSRSLAKHLAEASRQRLGLGWRAALAGRVLCRLAGGAGKVATWPVPLAGGVGQVPSSMPTGQFLEV
jgi:hypothetical protein